MNKLTRRDLGVMAVAAVAACSLPRGAAAAALPSDSLYQLDIQLTDQDGKTAPLAAHRGRVELVTMFYTSCKFVCPLIISTIQKAERALTEDERSRLGVLLVSIDPARDTPKALKATAEERKLDLKRWSLTRTDPSSVRKLAAALGIQYRALSDGEMNHSSVLTLLDAEGRTLARSDKLGQADPELVKALRAALGPKK